MTLVFTVAFHHFILFFSLKPKILYLCIRHSNRDWRVVSASKASCNYDTLVYCSYHSLVKDYSYSSEVYIYIYFFNLFICVHTSVSYPLDLFLVKIIKYKPNWMKYGWNMLLFFKNHNGRNLKDSKATLKTHKR